MQRQKQKQGNKKQSKRAVSRKQSNTQGRSGPRANPMIGIASSQGMKRTITASSHLLRDHDLIANITTPVSSAGAAIRIPCNPRFWPNTKAYQESLGFQCYSPRDITVHWRPAVATTAAGQIVGGSLAVQQNIDMLLLANALMSVPGSQAGPVWKDMSFKIDLSVLTQPRYFLNSTGDDGIPCVLYLILPATAIGMVEVSYTIECSGHCTAPSSIPVYDLIPRSFTTPADMTTSSGVLGSSTGIVSGNRYMITLAGQPAIATNVIFTTSSGGGGSTAIDTSQFGSQIEGLFLGSDLYIYEGPAINTYLNTAAMENEVLYLWISGNKN